MSHTTVVSFETRDVIRELVTKSYTHVRFIVVFVLFTVQFTVQFSRFVRVIYKGKIIAS